VEGRGRQEERGPVGNARVGCRLTVGGARVEGGQGGERPSRKPPRAPPPTCSDEVVDGGAGPGYARTTMTAIVSSFLEVGGAPYRYSFLLVVRNVYEDGVRDELNRQAEAFGADMRGEGLFARAYPQRMYETADEVTDREWPDDLAERLRDDPDPVLLVLDGSLWEFDPREHPYALIWLSDFHGDPQAIRPVLQILARKTRGGEDVIEYLRGVAERTQREARKGEVTGAVGIAARLASYVEIKPQLFGVSIDLKALLGDIGKRG
jgi:hypothetical protein